MNAQPSSQKGADLLFADRMAQARPSAIREILKTTEAPDVISFAGGLPAPELFPVEQVRAATEAVLSRHGAASLQYSVTEGNGALREWVAGHLQSTVGLHTRPESVLITHGSQQALDLVTKVLVNPGDVILVEEPAYLGALQVFRSYEAHVIGLPSDEHGLDANALESTLRSLPAPPKFLYVIPNFQNPTGASLRPGRRVEIAALADQHGLLVVEDDPYGELRYSGENAQAVCASMNSGRWVYLGTASKILTPGLRVAWMTSGHRGLAERLVTAKQAVDLHTSTFSQLLVHALVSQSEWFATHLATLRRVYRSRRDVMTHALHRELGSDCHHTLPDGGLFLWLALPGNLDATDLLRRAMEVRVAFVPGEPFWVTEPRRNTLRLNFSNASEERIAAGVKRLALVTRPILTGGR